MLNRFAAKCATCSINCAPGAGDLRKGPSGWVTTHTACPVAVTPHLTLVPAAATAPRSFTLPDVTSVEVAGCPAELLFAHQAQVVAAVQGGARSILLADEPGLGKTAVALIALVAAGSRRAVIVVPAVVKLNWQREANRWSPDAVVQILSGRKPAEIDPATNIIIINFDILTSWAPTLAKSGIDALVVDEAHMIKDSRSARSTAVSVVSDALPARSLRMLLTGTPIPNRPSDLIAPLTILGLLNRPQFGGFWAYAKRFCRATQSSYGWDLSGAAHLDELHENLLSVGMVRRRKADAVDLPSRTVCDVPVLLTGEGARTVAVAQAALINRLAKVVKTALKEANSDPTVDLIALDAAFINGVVSGTLASGGFAFEEMAALRSALGIAKAPLAAAYARDLLEGSGQPVVIMLHHRAAQDLVATALADHGVVRVTGGQAADARQSQIDAFQAGDAQVAVCSIQAAGVGITLHAASQMVLGELPWTAAAQDQAIDRIHRIGQDRPVTAWRIIAAGTLDERLAEVIQSKAAISLAAIDGGVVAAGTEEILAADAITDLILAAIANPVRKARKARAPRKTKAIASIAA